MIYDLRRWLRNDRQSVERVPACFDSRFLECENGIETSIYHIATYLLAIDYRRHGIAG
jgi:hypothetical protein